MKITRAPKDSRLDWLDEELSKLGTAIRRSGMSNKETGGVSRAHKALEAVKAKAKAVKDKAEDKGTINTPRTRNIYDEAQEALEALKAGKISSKEARARARLLHEQSTHVKLELDHARHTQRLVKGSPELPGFVRVPPKLTPE